MDVIPATRMPRFVDLEVDVGRLWTTPSFDDEPEVPGVTEVHRPDLVDPVPIATVDSAYVTFVEGNLDA